jgi:uncharacterized protein YecT (DUF1311 family)
MQNRYLARAVVFAALAALAAGCSASSSSSSPASSTGSATASPSSSPSAQVTTAPAFAAIVEPFDPGHPARTRTGPAICGSQSSTQAIVACYQIQTENVDTQIDSVQQGYYTSAPLASVKAAIVSEDSSWLAARGPVCSAAFRTGGTIDQITTATCLLEESNARLDAIKDVSPPKATLKSTDSINPDDLSWYTTPEGSRIAEIDTQGDQTGGAIVAWVIIGGADGFVVNPKQFYYQDGSFTDPGIIQGPDPANHKVADGAMYQFDIDYSQLSHDPDQGRAGGYEYVPGSPVAVWR